MQMSAQSSSGFLRNAELAAGVRRRGKVEVKIKEGIEGVVATRSWTFCHELRYEAGCSDK